MVSFGRDLIAEKNRKEHIKSRIIKYWNVNYIDPEEERRKAEEAQMDEAKEVLERFEQEKADDNVRMQKEIEQAYLEAQMKEEAYNATTGSYSGMYGQGEVDHVTKDQVQMILNEKNAAIQNLINSGNKQEYYCVSSNQ